MKVYIVEYRQIKLKNTDKEYIECLSAHVASSFDKAVKFCKRSTNYNEHTEKEPWWFTITEEEVDNEKHSELLAIIGWTGELLHEEPSAGYPKILPFSLKNVVDFSRN